MGEALVLSSILARSCNSPRLIGLRSQPPEGLRRGLQVLGYHCRIDEHNAFNSAPSFNALASSRLKLTMIICPDICRARPCIRT